ncbi:ABC transporter ATP-binding protein [Mesorhizobium sp. P5_C1]
MDTIVEFLNITKTYDGRTRVVRNLDLKVARGEFLTMLGPSGSGKTTSLMMLAGFEAPSSGEILLEGKSLSSQPPYRRDIGVVFQNYALFPHMTVGQNIAFPLVIRGMSRSEIDAHVARALDMVRLPQVSGRRPAELSGGQQQRVALARALVFEPKIVLMDEPLGALDRQLREEMQLEIRAIHKRLGVTVVYVTHDQGEALTMSDRIAIFNNGVVEQLAGPETLYEHPENAFVARFVGENNLLPGLATQFRGDACEVEVSGSGRLVARVGDIRNNYVNAVVSIRPEKVRLALSEDGSESANSFPAVVEEVVYLGDQTKLIMRLRGGQSLIAKMPTSSQSRGHRAGQDVTARWDWTDCVAFKEEPRPVLAPNEVLKSPKPVERARNQLELTGFGHYS